MPARTTHLPARPDGPPPLTQILGRTERLLRAVLDRELQASGLSFPAWTALSTLGRGPQEEATLVADLVGSRVAPAAELRTAVTELRAAGLVSTISSGGSPGGVALTAGGERIVAATRDRVGRRTAELYGDLPGVDIDATRRTLTSIADRATAALTRPAQPVDDLASTGRPASTPTTPGG